MSDDCTSELLCVLMTVQVCVCWLQEVEGSPVKMTGNVLTMVERADDEFTKILQSTDAHSTDYVTKYVIQYHIPYSHLNST